MLDQIFSILSLNIFEQEQYNFFARFGFNYDFLNINIYTVIYTWVILLFLILIIIICNKALSSSKNSSSNLKNSFNSIVEFFLFSFIKFFRTLILQTLGKFNFTHFSFICSLFLFILLSNLSSLIPNMGEPTSDIMTTLALGITGFLYTQISAIRAHGLFGHLKNYFEPFFLMAPLNIIGNLAGILSLSFRLFGNIAGGSMIFELWHSAVSGNIVTELAGILSFANFVLIGFFVIFEGFIQAFVFAMLSLTYLSLEVKEQES